MTIENLKKLVQVDIQNQWRWIDSNLDINQGINPGSWESWSTVELNEKGYISWEKGKNVLWLGQQIIAPELIHQYDITGLSLRVILTWWADKVEIFVNGNLVQEGDLFDSQVRLLLSTSVKPHEIFNIAIRLISPFHDQGALVKSICLYESLYPLNRDKIAPSFFADELTILQSHLSSEILNHQLKLIDFSALPDQDQFHLSLDHIRTNLQKSVTNIKDHTIYIVGHSHLDMAWLWTVDETWIVAENTFKSVFQLQENYPHLTFCHSTPALYCWLEQNKPELFTKIQEQVNLGKWEILGGMWVEPEINLLNGESIVRQLLYGQRYIKAKFGQFMKIAWLPDTFGFCWQLPQFLKQAEIEYFVTQKMTWNDTTKFPHPLFLWRSPDGSQILSLMSAPIGEGIDGVKIHKYQQEWQEKTNLSDYLWLMGVGDHGGGPTRDMLELAQRWESSDFFPKIAFSTVSTYLDHVKNNLPDNLPIYDDELYLEFHRGCYTTHGDQKRFNRVCEGLLYQAELWSTIAKLSGNFPYPQGELETLWKQVLFNQFHDILPGTSIPEVFTESNRNWLQVIQNTTEIIQQSLQAIARKIQLPSPPEKNALPFLVFNPLNWERTEIVSLKINSRTAKIYDVEGKELKTQKNQDEIAFLAENIPSVGYRLFWVVDENREFCTTMKDERNQISLSSLMIPKEKESFPDHWQLENEYLQVIVDEKTGNLASIYDKINHREILAKPSGNELQFYQDQGQYWDAWNIDPKYQEYPLKSSELKSIEWLENGEIQQTIRIMRIIGKSEFSQDYILTKNQPIVKIVNRVNWQENHLLVKASFPLNIEADFVSYETSCVVIKREVNSPVKWEVPALRWANVDRKKQANHPIYGVSLLNDCKYGYDAIKNTENILELRLTLLRSSAWPDPKADIGYHEFTYCLYPHQGTWQNSQVVKKGYELNIPLQPFFFTEQTDLTSGQLPPIGSFLNLGSDDLILMAFKQSEDQPHEYILRCYETHGHPTAINFSSDMNIAIAHQVNLLEINKETPLQLDISPWQIASFRLVGSRT
jgi:alpha-mannosidase